MVRCSAVSKDIVVSPVYLDDVVFPADPDLEVLTALLVVILIATVWL